MSLKKINDEVYYSEGDIVKISKNDIAFLVEKAAINEEREKDLHPPKYFRCSP